MKPLVFACLATATALILGCRSWLIHDSDKEVYTLIESRQRAALGATSDATIGTETGELGPDGRMYDFTPRPTNPGIPEAFRTSRGDRDAPPVPIEPSEDQDLPPGEAEFSPSIFSEKDGERIVTFGLPDALGYAQRHARELQNAKEELYIAALDLALERHLWTPQFAAEVAANYRDLPNDAELDSALSAISELSVTQRLPFGGEIGARMIHSMLREVEDHVSKGESGQAILEANIPLLRGAGRVAYESRYEAERELIYAVRTYERFRRSFLVSIASEYFALQQAKAAIGNTFTAYKSRQHDWEKAEFLHRMGRSATIFEAPRAKANLRDSEADLVSAKERYGSSLDRFKIRVGMPVDTLLDVVGQADDEASNTLDALLPAIDEATAVSTALTLRLDLLTRADEVDDARRGVVVAKNRILPDLELQGDVTFDSPPDQLRPSNLREERTTWHGGIQLSMNDRKAERTAYRASLVALRRAEREYQLSEDTVRAEVRRALRRIDQQDKLRMIEQLDVLENEVRLEAARTVFDLGRSTNQDVVDAEDDLLSARNAFATAIAAYRIAILQFRLDTDTLRVADDGRWTTGTAPDPSSSMPPADDS